MGGAGERGDTEKGEGPEHHLRAFLAPGNGGAPRAGSGYHRCRRPCRETSSSRPGVCTAAEIWREFSCGRCGVDVCVCPRCDHGQRYCGEKCSSAARKAAVQRASRAYQRTFRGSSKHRERQKRYLERRAERGQVSGEEVTQHSVTEECGSGIEGLASTRIDEHAEATIDAPISSPDRQPVQHQQRSSRARCSFCRRMLPRGARLDRKRPRATVVRRHRSDKPPRPPRLARYTPD